VQATTSPLRKKPRVPPVSIKNAKLASSTYQVEDESAANELYQDNGWTDGLPIVAPTEERVNAFLAAGRCEGDEVIGVEPVRRRRITAEKVAIAAVMAGFGAVISEVGASMMVGGNILHSTRVLTTATVMETGRGNFDVAIALSVILLSVTLLVNYLLTLVQQRERPR